MARPKRNVRAAAEEALTPPDELEPGQAIARVLANEGNNLYSVALPGGKTALVLLQAVFRRAIWLRRGGFVLVERLPEGDRRQNEAVVGEIVNVVRDEKAWRKMGYWPKEFPKNTYPEDEDDEEDSNVGKLPPTDEDEED